MSPIIRSRPSLLWLLQMNNSQLTAIHDKFLSSYSGRILCVCEGFPKIVLYIFSLGLIVSSNSARIPHRYRDNTRNLDFPSKDHSSLNKFPSRDDPVYCACVDEIETSIIGMKSSLIKDCLGSLKRCSENRRQTSQTDSLQALHNTCRWIYDIEHYTDWKKADNSVLWIVGKAGSGKSTLLLKMLKDAQRQFIRDGLDVMLEEDTMLGWPNSGLSNRPIVASYFYSHSDGETQFHRMLQSILFQILIQVNDLCDIAQASELWDLFLKPYKKSQHKYRVASHGLWSIDDLFSVFEDLWTFSKFTLQLRIFIDAIDESDESSTLKEEERKPFLKLLGLLPELKNEIGSRKANIKIVVTSRPTSEIYKKSLAAFQVSQSQSYSIRRYQICVTDHNEIDLDYVIDTGIDEIQNSFTGFADQENFAKDMTNSISSCRPELKRRAAGVILWVSLILRDIKRGVMDKKISPAGIKASITAKFPKELDDLYVDMVQRIRDQEGNDTELQAQSMLIWATFANRLLQVSEFYHALAFTQWRNANTDDDLRDALIYYSTLQDVESLLFSTCGGFLEVRPSCQTEQSSLSIKHIDAEIRLFHRTIRRFLQSKSAEPLRIEKSPSLTSIVEVCTRYLRLLFGFKWIRDSPTNALHDQFINHLDNHPLLLYIFQILPLDIERLDSLQKKNAYKELSQIFVDGLAQDHPIARYILCSWLLHTISRFEDDFVSNVRPAYWKQEADIYRILFNDPDFKKLSQQFYAQIINVAIRRGQLGVMRIMDAIGVFAVNNAEFVPKSLALSGLKDAIEGDQWPIVDFLAYHQSQQALTQIFTEALRVACLKDEYTKACQLLARGARPDDVDDNQVSLLHLAIGVRSAAIAGLLLQHGANSTLPDKENQTPLLLAVKSRQDELVQLLLSYSVSSINIKNNADQSPIACAMSNGDDSIVRLLLLAGAKMPRGLRPPEALKKLFMVPNARVSKFFGREEGLTKIHNNLRNPGNLVVLSGMGGVGKTQIALEYSFRYRDLYEMVFWVDATNEKRFYRSHEQFAKQVLFSELGYGSIESIQRLYLQLFNIEWPWLVIWDNANEECLFNNPLNELLQRCFPPGTEARIIVTTRNLVLADKFTKGTLGGHMVPIEPFSVSEGAQLLSLSLGIESNNARDNQISMQLAEMLGGHPLAIIQASTYITRTGISLQRYLELFQNEWPADRIKYSQSIWTTWKSVYQGLSSLSAKILSLISVYDRDAIPIYLLSTGEVDKDILESVATLRQCSLITMSAGSDTVAMHAMVQSFVTDKLARKGELDHWKMLCLKILADKFPVSEYEDWRICQELLPHAIKALSYNASVDMKHTILRCTLLYKTGLFLLTQGKYEEAGSMLQEAYLSTLKSDGPNSPRVLAIEESLALVFQKQAKYYEGERLYNDILGQLPAQDLSRKRILLHLGRVYQDTGRLEEAENSIRDVLREYPDVEKPEALDALAALASVLTDKGAYVEAEKVSRQALELRERMLGRDHPLTLDSLNNFATVLFHQGQFEESEVLFRTVIEARKAILGEHHPSTLDSISNLAATLAKVRNYDEGEDIERKVLQEREELLGSRHPDTLRSVWNLASIEFQKGNFHMADSLFLRATNGLEEVLGPEHSTTKACVEEYANLLAQMKRDSKID